MSANKKDLTLSELEEKTLEFWQSKGIFQKSLDQTKTGEPFVFFEGPPTANGKPGLHHIIARSFKDIICRYQTMRGRYVARQAGWDTHGLPVEIQVEKELGLKSKSDIENLVPSDKRASIKLFNQKCKESVWQYKDLWENLTARMGYWLDMDNPYITYNNDYIESLWSIISEVNTITSALEFQLTFMYPTIKSILKQTSSGLSCSGFDNIVPNKAYLFIANHRDILLDSAILQRPKPRLLPPPCSQTVIKHKPELCNHQ